MIAGKLQDGRGSSSQAGVDVDGGVSFTELPRPPYGGRSLMRVFRQYLTDDGTSTGSSDMAVDGSTTNVNFWVPAGQENDRYICRLDFVIADAGQGLNEFANTNSALTNGCRFFYEDDLGEVDIHDALKTNWDFVRLAGGNPAIGATTDAFRASNVSGASEGYIPQLDLRTTFGFRWGLRLAFGTVQRLVITIRDDCTAADQFDVIAYGFERLPD